MISSKLLCHTVTVKTKTGIDADRKATYTESEVSGVRVSTTLSVNNSSYGKTASDSMTLISDKVATTPKDFVPQIGMKVIFDGREYEITSVKPCYAANSFHHYSAGLK